VKFSARATRKVAVLLIEENVPCARLHQTYLSTLESYQFDVTHAQTGLEALERIKTQPFDLVLMNLQVNDIEGIELFKALNPEETACVIVSETGSMNQAVTCMRLGAKDFLVKPASQAKLCEAVDAALSDTTKTPAKETPNQSKSPRSSNPGAEDGFETFIGASPQMQHIYQTIQQAAPSKAPVFIMGESGTGKELCAEAIHNISDRADKPFIAINCSALPRDLIESEIFGHAKGAFTGAHTTHIGAAEQADGGILFLDEICEMDMALQAKLLRFIQTGEIKPVGSSQTKKVDVRFICATNKNPQEAVAKNEFREDLFYRLHVLPISLPPLRARGEDTFLIAERMLHVFMKEEGKTYNGFTDHARNMIQNYAWPGNVRQLLNVMRHIVVMNDGGLITPEMLGPINTNDLANTAADMTAKTDTVSPFSQTAPDLQNLRPLWEIERDAIEDAILACGGNIVEAAHYLKVSPSTIYRKRQAWMPSLKASPRPAIQGSSRHHMTLAH